MQLSRSAFLTIVRASAAYDFLLTAPFATPWTFAYAHAHLSALNESLGGAPLPPFGPFHVLFACLMGSIVLVWSVLRLRAPSVTLGRYAGHPKPILTGVAMAVFGVVLIAAVKALGG